MIRGERPSRVVIAVLALVGIVGACGDDEQAAEVPLAQIGAKAFATDEGIWVLGGTRGPGDTTPRTTLPPGWAGNDEAVLFDRQGVVTTRVQLALRDFYQWRPLVVTDRNDTTLLVANECPTGSGCLAETELSIWRLAPDPQRLTIEYGDVTPPTANATVVGQRDANLWLLVNEPLSNVADPGNRLLLVDLDKLTVSQMPLPDVPTGAQGGCLIGDSLYLAQVGNGTQQRMDFYRHPLAGDPSWHLVGAHEFATGSFFGDHVYCAASAARMIIYLATDPFPFQSFLLSETAVSATDDRPADTGQLDAALIDDATGDLIWIYASETGDLHTWRLNVAGWMQTGTVKRSYDEPVQPIVLDGQLRDATGLTRATHKTAGPVPTPIER